MPNTFPATGQPDISSQLFTVSQVNRLTRELIERQWPLLRIGGEISGLSRASSGHLYFTLKDDQSQIRCTMWRSRAQTLSVPVRNGMQIEARALATLYEARGEFQLNIQSLREAGQGSIFERFIALKEKLTREGLFDAHHKKILPRYPQHVAIITSASGAALQDILATLQRRAPAIKLRLFHASVQGQLAIPQLIEAFAQTMQYHQHCPLDLVILTRGGGSLEDLQAFNDEQLARTIAACPLPVVSGIGHETDTSIADFVADVRATTPTSAAEMISAAFVQAQEQLAYLGQRLHSLMDKRFSDCVQRFDYGSRRLTHPRQRLHQHVQTLHQQRQRFATNMQRNLNSERQRMALLCQRLSILKPDLAALSQRLDDQRNRLSTAMHQRQLRCCNRVQYFQTAFEHLSPTAVLARGYSITRRANGEILRDSCDATLEDTITVELAHGHLTAVITDTKAMPDE